MIQSKEYIIHQIANDIKNHIGQKYKDKSNIDWGLYTGLLGLIVFFCFTAVRKISPDSSATIPVIIHAKLLPKTLDVAS